MNIQSQWDFSKIPVNQAFTSRLMVKVEAPRKSGRPRRPLNVAVVLDRSGSMSGAKLQRVKEATRILVGQLGPEDIFSLTVFDTIVTPLLTPMPVRDGGQSIARTIDRIESGSSTNLSGGYLQGCDFARRNNTPERINRVILLSDGLANVGITHPHELARLAQAQRQENITTSTIGVGSDFNEELMGKMAEQGGGSTYFIDRPEEAESVFLEELGDLKAVAAPGFQIRFVPSLSGVQAAQLNNYDQPTPGVFFMGDILEGIAKHLVLEVKLPPVPQEGRVAIGRLEITFREAVETGFEDQRVEIPVELEVVSLDEFATVTPDREVTLQAAYLTVGAVKAESIRLSDQGRFVEAAAVMENCAKKLSEMQLHDERLDRMIRELFESARQLRHRGEEYYTPRQRKQTYYEAELDLKSQNIKGTRMRERQEASRYQAGRRRTLKSMPEETFEYPCYLLDRLVFFETEGDRVLLETASPHSVSEHGAIRLCGEIIPVRSEFNNMTTRDFSRQLGARFSVFLGSNILSEFDFIIDLANQKIIFSRGPLQIPGEEIRTVNRYQCPPAVQCRLNEQKIILGIDSGAKISFLNTEYVTNYESIGTETDYFPGFGEFSSEVYLIPIQIGNQEYCFKFGTVPRILEYGHGHSDIVGVIGTELFEQGPVCFSNKKNTLTLG